jgi:uncharacterized protein YeaO (DUF488 family)
MVALKRAYEPAEENDGYRVLVDRLWPRGIRKEALVLDAWEKALAPSPALRQWFGHDPKRFDAFATRYRRELAAEPARSILEDLRARAAHGNVTLLIGARDVVHSNGSVLQALLSKERPIQARARAAAKRRSSAKS